MLLFVLVFCVLFAYAARRITSSRNQRAAIAALQQRGGTGAKFSLGNVRMLQLTGNHNDESLSRLADLPELVNLNATCPSIYRPITSGAGRPIV